MTEPADSTPPPPAKKYAFADYLFQFVTITAGVLIALLINGLVQWNDNRALVAQARATIAREIAANKTDLDKTVLGFADDQKAFASAIQFAEGWLSGKPPKINKLNLHVNLADLSSASWRSAERTGALAHMDFDEVQRYSILYDFQDLFVEQQRSMVSQLAAATALLTADFNPDKPNLKDFESFRAQVMVLSASLAIQEDMASRLREKYAVFLK
jgi:hypothetical protein